jgi:hypothetical protein
MHIFVRDGLGLREGCFDLKLTAEDLSHGKAQGEETTKSGQLPVRARLRSLRPVFGRIILAA